MTTIQTNSKKILAGVLAMTMLVVTLTGCNSKPKAPEVSIPEFSITIEGVEGVTAFTDKDAAKLTITELDTVVTNKKGEKSENKYSGVLLKDLLASIGVKELSSLKLEAADGYTSEYDSTLAFADDVIVGWLQNGEPLKDNAINILPANGSGNQQVKSAVKLIIVK